MQWTRLDNSPTGKGVIVMGGITEKDSKAIFELSQLIQWKKIGHFAPLAIPIPDELVSKQEKNDIFISI